MTGPPRILVIEDDTNLGEIIEEVMIDEGYEVRRTNNGRAGLALMGDWEPDVVLLDVMMPNMNAFQVRQHQRRMNIGPSVRLVVLSAAGDIEATAAELEADGWLAKPFALGDLIDTVRRLTAL
jgi:two-component system OmpR family response regulator